MNNSPNGSSPIVWVRCVCFSGLGFLGSVFDGYSSLPFVLLVQSLWCIFSSLDTVPGTTGEMHPCRNSDICQTMSSARWQSQGPCRSQGRAGWQRLGGLDDLGSSGICRCYLLSGVEVRELFIGKAQLALRWHFLKQVCHSTTFTCLGLQKERKLLLLPHFSQHIVGLEAYVNWCLDWHIFGKSIPNTPADGWHTCFPESWFKNQPSVSLVQDFCARFCTFPRDNAKG